MNSIEKKRLRRKAYAAAGLCLSDGRPVEPGFKSCHRCRERYTAYNAANKTKLRQQGLKRQREVKANRHAKGLCIICGRENARENLRTCFTCSKKFTERAKRENRSRRNYRVRKAQAKAFIETLQAYGGKCTCCGESEAAFLTIDHMNGDGAEHRRKTWSGGGQKLYAWLRRNGWPDGFRILCFNCNCARYYRGNGLYGVNRDALGKCPHELKRNDPTWSYARPKPRLIVV